MAAAAALFALCRHHSARHMSQNALESQGISSQNSHGLRVFVCINNGFQHTSQFHAYILLPSVHTVLWTAIPGNFK